MKTKERKILFLVEVKSSLPFFLPHNTECTDKKTDIFLSDC